MSFNAKACSIKKRLLHRLWLRSIVSKKVRILTHSSNPPPFLKGGDDTLRKTEEGGIGNFPQKGGDSKKGGIDMQSSFSGQVSALFCTFVLSMGKFAPFTMYFLFLRQF